MFRSIKLDIHLSSLRVFILLCLFFASFSANARLVVGFDYNGGFERITGLQDTGQSYYVLSKELSELGFSLAYNSGRTTTYVEYKQKTVKYESGESVILNEEDFIENDEVKIGFSTGKFNLFKMAIGQGTQTFITNVDGFNVNIEALKVSFVEIGFRANIKSTSTFSIGADTQIRHYFGGTESSDYDFKLEHGRTFGGSLNLDFGKWNGSGMVFRTYLAFEHEQFYENKNSQTRTNVDLGVKLYFNF